MAKYYGNIGYNVSKEDPNRPGIYLDGIIERKYRGNINRINKNSQAAENIVGDFRLNMEIDIMADGFAFENFSNIVYAEYMGSKWEVTAVQVRRPRLILNFGGVYNEQSRKTTSSS